jgi:hypothetical protein
MSVQATHPPGRQVFKIANTGTNAGPYTFDVTDPNTKQVVHDHGNYLTAYRKQPDGSWKAEADSVTLDAPPPAPPAPKKK